MKNKSMKKILIIELLIFICWCVVVLAFADYDKVGFYFWGGFGFGVLSFVISAMSLIMIDIKNNRNSTEINFIPVYYTVIYLVVTFCVNSFFVFKITGRFNIVLVVANMVALVAFAAVRLFTDDYKERVERQTDYVTEKTRSLTNITAVLSSIISAAEDQEVKKQLLKLKETVDYSANLSQRFTQESQDMFLLQLNQIQTMIQENKDKEEVKNKIQEASRTWNTRNGLTTAMK